MTSVSCSDEIVAKYTKKGTNETEKRSSASLMSMHTKSEEIVAKYTAQIRPAPLKCWKSRQLSLSSSCATSADQQPFSSTTSSSSSSSNVADRSLSCSSSLEEHSTKLGQVSRFAALSINNDYTQINNKWTLWSFECGDFPSHSCQNADACKFCESMLKYRDIFENTVDEGNGRWECYFKKENTFDDQQQLLKVVNDDGFLPSKFATKTFFNRKLGVAVFRGENIPKTENVENRDGGVFQMLLLATSGQRSATLLPKMDSLFMQTLQLMFGLSPSIGCHVNGLLYRCKINPGMYLEQEEQPYKSRDDLPFLAKLEIWFDDLELKHSIHRCLINEIDKMIMTLEIPDCALRKFIFTRRFRKGSLADYSQYRNRTSKIYAMIRN